MTTTIALGQILPMMIIMTGDSDDSMAQGVNIIEKMQSNASSRRASLSSQITMLSLPFQDLYKLEKDEIGAYNWEMSSNEQKMFKPIRHSIA